jgi:ABC-2 type transport system ATP-binding protein
MIKIENITKVYEGGFKALADVTLHIEKGKILALLGPNGAGKTTLISTICGLVEPTSGDITVGGFDIKKDYRQARALIGLVPQEVALDPFATIRDIMQYTRGFFGKHHDEVLMESTLKKLSLWDKRDEKINALSGGMKRRVLIARALISEPRVLFLDEPTAGVDVELRRELMNMVQDLKKEGMTIILTTHYLEEAERLADKVGLIQGGVLEFVEEKEALLKRFNNKKLEDIYVELVQDAQKKK